MRHFPLLRAVALAAVLASAAPLAHAQSNLTPQQIQGQIANGNEVTALSELNVILQSNPQSGVGWYLTAEAQGRRWQRTSRPRRAQQRANLRPWPALRTAGKGCRP